MYRETRFSLLVYMGVKIRFFVVSGDHRLRVFGNSVLRKILEPKREVVTGE